MKSVLLALLFVCGVFAAPSNAPEPGADLFATNAPVVRVRVDIPEQGIRSLEREPRKDVLCSIHEGDRVYTNVTVHLKGAAGSFRGIHDGPSLTLNFAKTNVDQRFHGLRKIHLNNSLQDRSFTTYNITSGMFNDAGIPAARVTNARFWMNGRDMGFYVLVEGFTKDFLKRYFEDTKGNLYDGGFLKEITDGLEKESGDTNRNNADLKALAAAANIQDPGIRWGALQKKLDVERFVNYMALEILMHDWDGYPKQRNNYRVYHDPKTDKMIFIPHGMDQMFWEPNASIYRPDFGGLVARAIFQTPEGHKAYRESVKQMFEKIYRLDVVTNRFENLVARNRKAVEELGRGPLREYDENTQMVRNRIRERWVGIKNQIDNEPKPVDFSKPVQLTNWHQQAQRGSAQFEEGELEGKPILRIKTAGGTIASWRTAVVLGQGRYRFEGLAKSTKLNGSVEDRGEGGGLRISGSNRSNKLVGDTGWTHLQFDFDVFDESHDTILVCEAIASRGEIVFDRSSLKLIKLR